MKIADRKQKKWKSKGVHRTYMEKRNRTSKILDEERKNYGNNEQL